MLIRGVAVDYKHWTSLTKNPVSLEAQSLVRRQLSDRYKGSVYNLPAFWEQVISEKSLLDIGVVEHSLEFSVRQGWRHGHFARLASRIVGIDILAEEVDQLRCRGYDVRVCDATSDDDLDERFDVIYIGDVIEHVNDPVRLVQFAARHLAANGRIYVSTPCPFWWRNIQLMISTHTFIGNVDHVRWVVPVNALEIGHRSGVPLLEYRTVETYGHNVFREAALSIVNKALGKSELFTWAYVYTFARREEDEQHQSLCPTA